uniref:Uncharacterized protein n=1 Tax=Romanomermis culicivorax TaxID=13658 RepID=A0A915ID78_ROMCU
MEGVSNPSRNQSSIDPTITILSYMSKLEEKFDQLKNNLRPLSPAISQPPVDRKEKPADSTISLNKQTNLNFMVSKFKQQISNTVQKSTLTPEQQCEMEKILISNPALFSLEDLLKVKKIQMTAYHPQGNRIMDGLTPPRSIDFPNWPTTTPKNGQNSLS